MLSLHQGANDRFLVNPTTRWRGREWLIRGTSGRLPSRTRTTRYPREPRPGPAGRGERLHHLAADHLFHLAGELFQTEGFGEEVDFAVAVEALAEGVLGIARDENDLHVGMQFAHLADQRR